MFPYDIDVMENGIDFDRALSFFVNVLGLKIARRGETYAEFDIEDGNVFTRDRLKNTSPRPRAARTARNPN